MKWVVIASALVLATGAEAQNDPVTNEKPAPAKEAPPPEVKSIDVKKGDQWVYELRDGLTDSLRFTLIDTISNVTDNELDVRLRTKAPNNAEGVVLETYDRRWRKTESPKATFKKNQTTFGVPEDLTVGKEWSYEYEIHGLDTSAYTRWAGHGEVAAWEKVTLPSGQSYDAYRIEYHEALTRNYNNQSEEAPSSRKIGLNVVLWYAPSVNRYVKRSFEQLQNGKTLDSLVEVLIGYSPRGTD